MGSKMLYSLFVHWNTLFLVLDVHEQLLIYYDSAGIIHNLKIALKSL